MGRRTRTPRWAWWRTRPGVKDVVDNLEVAPLSPMDDRCALRLARAIYGTPQLQKYALDPAKPIRITVVNGNVTLSGVVDSKMDRDVAGIRANSVPGVFKVMNNLQVAGPQPGSRSVNELRDAGPRCPLRWRHGECAGRARG